MTVALLDLSWGGAVLREVTWRERLAARLHGADLDEALVAGVPPEAEAALTLHARRLIALAERLQRRGAVDARGVALARELLRDGLGALYADRGGPRLAEAAREATEALDPD